MQFTVARSLICAITLTPVIASPFERPGDLLTFDLPHGYGVNGTIVMDIEKSSQYLQDEVGVGIDTDMDKVAKILPVLQENSEYRFPEGNKKTKLQEMCCLHPADTHLPRIRGMLYVLL
ncbi:hypothetical protein DL771_002766 [Monosporascus sp. 5C6A]|nr:hypothetical protein DL771_002766 [Monosporascus sp. 5C6A]